MASPLVSRTEALRKQTHHQFVPGFGYLAHSGPPELPAAANGNKNCQPPSGTKNGSRHSLKPPDDHPAMDMIWVAAERAWASPIPGRGNRLAWPVDHLSRAGWEYVGPAPEPKKSAK